MNMFRLKEDGGGYERAEIEADLWEGDGEYAPAIYLAIREEPDQAFANIVIKKETALQLLMWLDLVVSQLEEEDNA